MTLQLTPAVVTALREAANALNRVAEAWTDSDQACFDDYLAAGNPSPFAMSIDEVATQIDHLLEEWGKEPSAADQIVALCEDEELRKAPGSYLARRVLKVLLREGPL